MSKIRQQRVADQIQFVLSDLCRRQLRDRRLRDLTITDVIVDRELQYADVYVNALGDESRQQEVITTLGKAAGFLRRELSSRVRLRSAPQLHFHWDPTLAYAEKVDQILDSLEISPEEE